TYRTGTQDDVLPDDGERLTTTVNGDPHSSLAIKQDTVHRTVGSDCQVEAVPARTQVAQGGTEADAVVIVGDRGPYTRSIGAIVVWAIRKAGGLTGVIEGALGPMPCLCVGMVDKDWAVCAMVVILIVNVGLDFPEVRQDLLEVPLVVTIRGP